MPRRFRNLEKLGSGGFAEVWRVSRRTDNNLFAKKILIDESTEAIKRFHREVRIFSKLDHPRIVKVLDIHLENKPYWYVMPLYKYSLFNKLSEVIRDKSAIFTIYTAIIEGMEYAHNQGVIHRDLKPENILMNDFTNIAISDFGLGRAFDAKTSRKTQTGDVFGTFFYMAPEQMIDAKNADERSDIYSLGRMLYELYTGPLTSLDQDLSRLPVGISIIVDRCTKREPQERFQTAGELLNSFQAIFDRNKIGDEKGKLRTLTGELIAGDSYDEGTIEDLNALICSLEGDEDEIQELCMKLPKNVFADLYGLFPQTVHTMINIFIEMITSQGWPFNYTDEIARACKKIVLAINDRTIRAKLIAAVMEVGVSHNRFFVINIFKDLICNYIDRSDTTALEVELLKYEPNLKSVASELDLHRLPDRLAELIVLVKNR